MAKKVSLKNIEVGATVGETEFTTHNGVKEAPSGITSPNAKAQGGKEFFPLVDKHALEAQDANDGTEDGKQDSFSMPPFANGTDKRHRG